MASFYEDLNQFYLFNYYAMEKLLQLLNEYNCNKLWYTDKREIKNNKFILDYKIWTYAFKTHLYIISTEYWFIKWLVENKKLNLIDFEEVIKGVEFTDNEEFDQYIFYSITDSLLMSLAIQDDPINFLVSILK